MLELAPAFFHDTLLEEANRAGLKKLLETIPGSVRVEALVQEICIVRIEPQPLLVQANSCSIFGHAGGVTDYTDLRPELAEHLQSAFRLFHEQLLYFGALPQDLQTELARRPGHYYDAFHFRTFWLFLPSHGFDGSDPYVAPEVGPEASRDQRCAAAAIFVPGARTAHGRMKAASDLERAWDQISFLVRTHMYNRDIQGPRVLLPFDAHLFERDLSA